MRYIPHLLSDNTDKNGIWDLKAGEYIDIPLRKFEVQGSRKVIWPFVDSCNRQMILRGLRIFYGVNKIINFLRRNRLCVQLWVIKDRRLR